MKSYAETQLLYLDTDASQIGLKSCPTTNQNWSSCPRDKAPDNSIIRPTKFASKGLSSAEIGYSNIERQALGILHSFKKFCHYCFAREVHIITDHKPLVTIFKKDLAMLSQRIQLTLLRIQQYRVTIIYTPGPDLFKADCLSRQNHKENKDKEIPGMQLNVATIQTTTNIPDCMMIQQLQDAMSQDDHLQQLKADIIRGWPENKGQILQDL